MDPSKLRKRQIARRLGVSEQILEQYLQLKRAEVLQPKPTGPETLAPDAMPTASPSLASGTDRSSAGTPTRPKRGHGNVHAGSAGRIRRSD